ncbi:CopG family transcriptional regulator [Microbacterium ulmi]|uniref:CopG family transcriptional regulator n=1 Tax=Microbacterium ulmi TaxID=179095 RepID=A0A7Y2M2M0_9MICO|nr:CopG family transcriptional regulator [Microbacterium ulmi]NII69702.1 hypothetical protein [Microbacterium ulmi]NNH05345.1 CopG family transcriptional regulator [Microbacterium ulmi]
MRTTLTIDDDVLAAAKQFADSRGITLGEAISQLARATLTERRRFGMRNGIMLLPTSPDAARATVEDVTALQDDAS